MQNRTPVPPHLRGDLATEKQLAFLASLAAERDLVTLTPEQQAWLNKGDFSKVTKVRASSIIETLLNLGHKPKQDIGLPEVQAGRYAIPNADGKLAFYVVSRPTEGRWSGYVFLDVMASDEKWPIKDFAAKKTILAEIAADPDAGPRFGREIGRCYVCGRTLTDELSRQLGIGPVCRGDQ